MTPSPRERGREGEREREREREGEGEGGREREFETPKALAKGKIQHLSNSLIDLALLVVLAVLLDGLQGLQPGAARVVSHHLHSNSVLVMTELVKNGG